MSEVRYGVTTLRLGKRIRATEPDGTPYVTTSRPRALLHAGAFWSSEDARVVRITKKKRVRWVFEGYPHINGDGYVVLVAPGPEHLCMTDILGEVPPGKRVRITVQVLPDKKEGAK